MYRCGTGCLRRTVGRRVIAKELVILFAGLASYSCVNIKKPKELTKI